jgi:ABC-2 type transport system ATP-binding protein
MSKHIFLEIKDLKKTFDSDLFKEKTEALKGVSCKFEEGSTTAIVGHNGAGKTTTIRTLLGLIQHDSGEILFKGTPISTSDRENIGYMPEVHRLTGALTPRETLKIHLKFYKKIHSSSYDDLIDAALSRVGLISHQKKYLKNLSKGLQRRLAFALATIHQPKLLVLDEPFSGLDPLAHGHMEKWIEAEKQRGATIIMSSHQVSSIAKTCDHFHVMLNGKVDYTSLSSEENISSSTEGGYTLEVSGVDENSLKELFSTNNLESPSAWHNTDFQHTLAYSNYQKASTALKLLLGEGVVVSKFSESSNITESLILSLLQKGDA